MTQRKADAETARAIFAEAHHWAALMYERLMKDKPELRPHAGTILAYAVESFLGFPCEHKGKGFDKMSRDFRDFLKVVHEDVKVQYEKINKEFEKQKNAN